MTVIFHYADGSKRILRPVNDGSTVDSKGKRIPDSSIYMKDIAHDTGAVSFEIKR